MMEGDVLASRGVHEGGYKGQIHPLFQVMPTRHLYLGMTYLHPRAQNDLGARSAAVLAFHA